MTIKVSYLHKQQIERDARGLLADYSCEQGKSLQPPVPVDDILETHLGLSLDFDDLQALLGIRDVLGALWVDKREVFIDQGLDPHEHPKMEGRYLFSVGHEIGHWRLHRRYLANAGAQAAIFANGDSRPTVVCRTSEARERIEWQADFFASCLLMPTELVVAAWNRHFGSLEPVVYADIAEEQWTRRPVRQGLKPLRAILSNVIEQSFEPHAYIFETVAREFAPLFRVSIQAMRIRLENLGLLLVNHPVQQDLLVSR